MANPAKVLDFLDITGLWDPSLAFVMGGAIIIGLISFLIAQRRTSSFLGLPIGLPSSTTIDKRLTLGSLAFGVGWGLAGICPGPSLVLLGAGEIKGLIFVASMVLGFFVFEKTKKS